jgi:hypothetical protein
MQKSKKGSLVKIIELGEETINSVHFTQEEGPVDPNSEEYKMLMKLFDKTPWSKEKKE